MSPGYLCPATSRLHRSYLAVARPASPTGNPGSDQVSVSHRGRRIAPNGGVAPHPPGSFGLVHPHLDPTPVRRSTPGQGAEVARLGVGDHLELDAPRAQGHPDQLVEAVLLRPRDLDGAVERRAHRGATARLRDVVRRRWCRHHPGARVRSTAVGACSAGSACLLGLDGGSRSHAGPDSGRCRARGFARPRTSLSTLTSTRAAA